MILRIAYKTLVNIETALFIASGILIVIAGVINANALMNKIGFPTWKEWWEDLRSTDPPSL